MPETLEIIIKATDKASKELQGVSDKLGSFSKIATGVGTALGAVGLATGALVGGFKMLVEPAVNYGLAVSDLATKLGTSATEASTFLQIADDLRISQTQLNVAFKTLNAGGIQPTLENLGKLSDEYLAIESPVGRAQFAMEKFGARAGPEMQRLLEQGSAGLREMAAAAQETGLVIDDLQASKMVDMYARMDEFGDRLEGLKTKVGFFLADTLMKAQDAGSQLITILQYSFGIISDEEMLAAASGRDLSGVLEDIPGAADAAADGLASAAAKMSASAIMGNAAYNAALLLRDGQYEAAAATMEAAQAAASEAMAVQALADKILANQGVTADMYVNVITTGGGTSSLSAWAPGAGPSSAGYGPVVEGPGGKMYRMNLSTGRYEPAAFGLDMIVPPGYGADNFMIGASSGERVVVQPAGQRSSPMQIGTVIINNGLDEQGFTLMMKRAAQQ